MIHQLIHEELRVHWTSHAMRWLDVPSRALEAVGLDAAAVWWGEQVSPVWNWLCDRQCVYCAGLYKSVGIDLGNGVSGS